MSEDSDAISNNVISMPISRASGRIGSGPLLPPPGGGGFDGIEARLAKMEAQQEFASQKMSSIDSRMEKLTDAVQRIEILLARLEERTASKGFIVTAVLSSLALLGALSVFGPQIRTILGLT